MKVQNAVIFAHALLKAAERAEAEGRDTLNTEDVDAFAAVDDAARAELVAAIEAAKR